MTNPNDLAFPSGDEYFAGLTKRELFAAMAMQGIISSHEVLVTDHGQWSKTAAEYVAANASAMADALLAELSKETK